MKIFLFCIVKIHFDSVSFSKISFKLWILRLFLKFLMTGIQALLEWRMTYLKEAVSASLILPPKGFSEFLSLQSTPRHPIWERQILYYACIL